jgi:hypothetical protein
MPTPTVVPFTVTTNRPVWLFDGPSVDSERIVSVEANSEVTILTFEGQWLLIEWQSPVGPQRGWLFSRWVDYAGTPPPELPVTPES